MEQTATNPQTGEKIVFRGGQWQPLTGAPQQGPISSGFKPVDPYKASAEQRAQEDQAFQREKFNWEREQAEAKATPAYSQSAIDAFDRAISTADRLKKHPGFGAAVGSGFDPQAFGSYNPITGKAFGGTNAAGFEGELEAMKAQVFLPMVQSMKGMGALSNAEGERLTASIGSLDQNMPEEQFQASLDRIIADLKIYRDRGAPGGASPNVARIGEVNQPEMIGNVPKGTQVEIGFNQSDGDQPYDRNRFLEQRGLDANKEATMVAFWNANRNNDALTPAGVLRFYAENNIPPPTDDDLNKMIEQAKQGLQFGPVDTSADEAAYRAELQKEATRSMGEAGLSERADQGLLLGYSDEIAGVGGAIGSLIRGDDPRRGYQFSRDVMRYQNEQADKNTGLLGDVVEIGAGLALPAGSVRTVGQGMRTGATVGAVGGFGYGEGAGGSATNALLGGGLGTALGGGGAKLGNVLAARSAAKAEAAPARNALLQAGVDEDVTVNRAMADPNLQSQVTGVSGTMAGSRRIERDMGLVSDQIEGRVANLGGKGEQLTGETGGGKIRAIAERQIKKSGESAKRIYDNAERQSAGIKVEPKESIAVLDNAIADLSETAGLNSAEISFLKTLKEDFLKDLSVGALRRARTTLRKKINSPVNPLTFGESEARVLSIMDAASNDIVAGLTAKGKGNAAKLFEKADGLYRERAKYIEGTLQKIIGKRNSNMSDQQVFAKFRSLADPKGDGPAMEKFMSELEPDEVADIAATFAADLGRNSKGEFSTAFLATQAEKLGKNPTALKAIFGEDGARSIKNLIILSKEHSRVTNAARGSPTGIRADYKSWLTNALFTGGAGLVTAASQGAGTGAVTAAVTAATVGGAKVAKDAFSARALMSPKITGWLRSAPRTADPKAIDAHFKKLGAIAKAEPALAGDIKSIQDFIFQAANDNQTRAVAAEQEPDRVTPER